MKVYLSGPMRGIKFYNFPAFRAAADALWEDGHEVISPHEMDMEAGINPYDLPESWDWNELPPGTTLEQFYDRDTQAIKQCDAVVMLEGWIESVGASAEMRCAAWLGKKVYRLDDLVGEAGRRRAELLHGADPFSPNRTAPTPAPTTEKDILEEALEITSGDRQNAYGPPDQDFARTAAMWSGLFGDLLKDGVAFEPFHVAQAMILLKMSRQLHQRSRDNWTDTAGYARCGHICDQEAAKKGGA